MGMTRICLGLGAACCLAAASVATAARMDEVTLVLVPREETPVQVGLDIADRYPTLLVSYRLSPAGEASLHGWTGSQWVNINEEDFRNGNFFRTGPDSALLVEEEGRPLPARLVPPAAWCPSVYRIATAETRPLLHLAGRFYGFRFKDWEWFAKRYGETAPSINPDGLNVAWYHKRLADHFKPVDVEGPDDLRYWSILRSPPPPVLADPVPVAVPEADAGGEPPAAMEADPLADEAPEAVVLAPGEADEAPAPAEAPDEKAADAP